MSLTFDSDQPANNLTGTDTTSKQNDPPPEPPQHLQTTPAPRPQAQQPTDLNMDSAPPREQRSR